MKTAVRYASRALRGLTVIWVLTCAWLLVHWSELALSSVFTLDPSPDPTYIARQGRRAAQAMLPLTAVAVGGAIALAVLAHAATLRRARTAYLVLALALGILAAPGMACAARTLEPPTPASTPSPTPPICQNRSGGEAECPGG